MKADINIRRSTPIKQRKRVARNSVVGLATTLTSSFSNSKEKADVKVRKNSPELQRKMSMGLNTSFQRKNTQTLATKELEENTISNRNATEPVNHEKSKPKPKVFERTNSLNLSFSPIKNDQGKLHQPQIAETHFLISFFEGELEGIHKAIAGDNEVFYL